jgi:hypothetical protein
MFSFLIRDGKTEYYQLDEDDDDDDDDDATTCQL